MVYTRTITLAGAELSSFLAAGGQTVNPASLSTPAAAAVANAGNVAAVSSIANAIPTITIPDAATTSAAAVATRPAATTMSPAVVATPSSSTPVVVRSSSSVAPVASPSSTAAAVVSSTSSTSAASSTSSTSAAAAGGNVVPAAAATTAAPVRAETTSRASRRNTSTTTTGIPAAQIALNNGVGTTSTGSIGGGGIAGLIIGLLVLAGIVAAAIFYFAKKRKDKRRAEYAEERSRYQRRNEKGAMRLDEADVGTAPQMSQYGSGQPGFNFGVLPAIAPAAPMNTTGHNYNQQLGNSQDMLRGAAVLGIQRPYTPPPGHPSHPNYQQPPSMRSITPKSQHSTRNFSGGPQIYQTQPRSLTSANPPQLVAPVPIRQSDANPFSDPEVAPPLAKSSPAVPLAVSESKLPLRQSGQSFNVGDDSSDFAAKPSTPVLAVSQITMTSAGQAPSHFERTRSVLQATDGWAQKKALVKNAIAQSPSSPVVVAAESSPFSDPAPLISHDISSAPMDIEFHK